LPLISPALAVLAAPPSRIAVANTVAAAVRNRMFPPEDDADGVETVLETGRSNARTAPPGAYFLDLDERQPLRVNAPGAVRDDTMCRVSQTSARMSPPAFFIRGKKCFVMLLNDHHDDGRLAIWCAAPDGVQADMVDTDGAFLPPAVRRSLGLARCLDARNR
jgi:hypothetical protein